MRRRIEIVHESLLTHWPRLVRWQTQDADGAQLRDELRQAAQLWDQHGRAEDFLWSGSALREYEVWRERYPGGLTELEEEFARAMMSVAERRRRRRRLVTTVFIAAILVVAIALGVMWRRGVAQADRAEAEARRALAQTQRAEAETRRATAAQLLAIGQSVLEADPPAALAWTIESLRLADTPEARQFAVEVLWTSPPASFTPSGPGHPYAFEFSPDGRWLGVSHSEGPLRVYSENGGKPVALDDFAGDKISFIKFSEDGTAALGFAVHLPKVKVWSIPSWTPLRTIEVVSGSELQAGRIPGKYVIPFFAAAFGKASDEVITWLARRVRRPFPVEVRRWFPDGGHTVVGTWTTTSSIPTIDGPRDLIGFGLGNEMRVARIDGSGGTPLVVGVHPDPIRLLGRPAFDRGGEFLVAADEGGTVAVWSLASPGKKIGTLEGGPRVGPFAPVLSRDSSLMCLAYGTEARLWELQGVTAAEPLRLTTRGEEVSDCGLHPSNRLAATVQRPTRGTLWNLTTSRVRVLRGHRAGRIAFAADDRYLYSLGESDGRVLRWPLQGGPAEGVVTVLERPKAWGWGLAIDPSGAGLVAVVQSDGTWKVRFDGTPPQRIANVPYAWNSAIDPTGRHFITSGSLSGNTLVLVVIDLETGERRDFGSETEGIVAAYGFDARGRIVVVRGGKLQIGDATTGAFRTLVASGAQGALISPDGRIATVRVDGEIFIVDLETESIERATWQRDPTVSRVALGPRRIIVEARTDGTIRVGRLDGGEAHLLLGHSGLVERIVVSNDGRWIAAATPEDAIYLWPMPDLDRPPLHTLPHGELLAKLESLTNLRAIPDAAAPSGYRIDVDDSAWRGWKDVPSW